MMNQQPQEVERKIIAILKVVSQSGEPLGARVISRRLRVHGIELSERAVRYHLKLMDERGFTQSVGRDGRLITQQGLEEVESALVGDKVGLVASEIELLAYQADFDVDERRGTVPVNISFFPHGKFKKALDVMREVFKAGICVSDLVAVAREGEMMGGSVVPQGKIGMATVCGIVVNGALLRRGIPVDSKFGGILQMREGRALRFVELIHYAGSSLDPSEIFIASRMTCVRKGAKLGNGRILASFREIPAVCKLEAEKVVLGLEKAGVGGLIALGEHSKPVCEFPVEVNKVGMILMGGLNPVAAAVESGIEVESHAMSAVIKLEDLVKVWEL